MGKVYSLDTFKILRQTMSKQDAARACEIKDDVDLRIHWDNTQYKKEGVQYDKTLDRIELDEPNTKRSS